MPLAAWVSTVLFMALMLALSLYGLTASGHFPVDHRPPVLKSGAGAAILFGTMAAALASLAAGIAVIWYAIPWFAAVIGGGLAVLVAPLLLPPFPDAFVNGRSALLAFSTAAALFACALLIMT